jgi:ribosomal protein S6
VNIGGVAHGVDVQCRGFQHTADLVREGLQIGGGERHAKEHMGETAIEKPIRKRKRLPDIMLLCDNQ